MVAKNQENARRILLLGVWEILRQLSHLFLPVHQAHVRLQLTDTALPPRRFPGLQ